MDAKLRAVAVWVASLLACVMPNPLFGDRWTSLSHQPLFLLIVPAGLACLSLLLPMRAPISEEQRAERMESKRRGNKWHALLLLSFMIAAFFGWCFLDACRDASTTGMERGELAGLAAVGLLGMWIALWKLKRLGHLWW